MAHRFHPRSTPAEQLRFIIHSIPWKLLFLLPVLIVIAVPTYLYATRAGNNVVPSITDLFFKLSAPAPPPTPTPLPVFPSGLPQAGSILYTVQEGDSCDSILLFQMHMLNAGEIFSDIKPETVKALNASLGQDCHLIQPGMTLPLSPHYPLVVLGGVVTKIEASTPQQVLPTPLIKIPPQQRLGVDCSGKGGCLLTLRIAPTVNIHLLVQTALPVQLGSWIWAQAMYPRKVIRGFDTYPYADPHASLNGATMRACDVQVDNTHDDDSLACSDLAPNTITIDGGSWLFGVTGPGGIDHWHYGLNLPPNTRVLLWLTNDKGTLRYHHGDPAYRYDDASHLYVKI